MRARASCSRCSRMFEEHWDDGVTAMRCGYRASPGQTARGRLETDPRKTYGWVTHIFRDAYQGAFDDVAAPAWCRGFRPKIGGQTK